MALADAGTMLHPAVTAADQSQVLNQEKLIRLSFRLEELMLSKKPYLNKDLSLNQLAGLLNSNQTYVSLVLNQQHGLKFNDYVNEYRVKETCRLLKTGESATLSIEHLAERSGFNSLSTFYHAFHKFTGMSPARFAKTNQENLSEARR